MSAEYHGHTRKQRPRLAIVTAFGFTILGAAAFAVFYVLHAGTQLLGAAFAVAFGGLAVGLTVWSRHLLPNGGYVEEHEGFSSDSREQLALADDITEIAKPNRRGLLATLTLAVLSIGGAALFPLRSLMQPRGEHVLTQLRETAWRAGRLRLVDSDKRPLRLADVRADTIVIVEPEGHTRSGDTASFVVRLDPSRFVSPPPAGHLSGVVAYSLLCTHAGCPVGLFEQSTGRMLCPCHQSVFNLLDGGRAVAGPAARSLPGLPITVGPDGFLYATGDFTGPPGAGYWSLP